MSWESLGRGGLTALRSFSASGTAQFHTSPPWCRVVKTRKEYAKLKSTKLVKTSVKTKASSWVRASISFPAEMYEALEEQARQKKVSLAWIVRDAAEKYLVGTKPATEEN